MRYLLVKRDLEYQNAAQSSSMGNRKIGLCLGRVGFGVRTAIEVIREAVDRSQALKIFKPSETSEVVSRRIENESQ